MGLSLELSVPMITVFLQGVLSFFSPCILPIIPLYMGYLAGDMVTDTEGNKIYNQKRVMLHTASFVIGISFAFFILGLGVSSVGQFVSSHTQIISQIGGLVIILFGVVQLGILKKVQFVNELRVPLKLSGKNMNPFTAFLMGFTFSFAWTPCVGPTLSTVLIMVSSSSDSSYGMVLMSVYTLGFIIPFMLLGVFTSKVLNFFKSNVGVIRYTTKIGAVLMIIIGILMVSGTMNQMSTYLNKFDSAYTVDELLTDEIDNNEFTSSEVDKDSIDEIEQEVENVVGAIEGEVPELSMATDFQLVDQYGKVHKLSDYKGKVVFLNFWATWCPPCVAELPDIQKVFEEYGYNEEDVIIIGVASPSDQNSWSREGSVSDVKQFLTENGYNYPTVMDMDGSIVSAYGINSYPSTFMINAEGEIFGYIPGMLEYDVMVDIIEQTK